MKAQVVLVSILTLASACGNDKAKTNDSPAAKPQEPASGSSAVNPGAGGSGATDPKPSPSPSAANGTDPTPAPTPSAGAVGDPDETSGDSDTAACETYVKTLIRCGADDAFLAAAFAPKSGWTVPVTKATWKKEHATFKKYEAKRICDEFGSDPENRWPFSNISTENVTTFTLALPKEGEADCKTVGAAAHATGLPLLNGE